MHTYSTRARTGCRVRLWPLLCSIARPDRPSIAILPSDLLPCGSPLPPCSSSLHDLQWPHMPLSNQGLCMFVLVVSSPTPLSTGSRSPPRDIIRLRHSCVQLSSLRNPFRNRYRNIRYLQECTRIIQARLLADFPFSLSWLAFLGTMSSVASVPRFPLSVARSVHDLQQHLNLWLLLLHLHVILSSRFHHLYQYQYPEPFAAPRAALSLLSRVYPIERVCLRYHRVYFGPRCSILWESPR
ncbi:hypothetical protein BD310DRAFT_669368 [Dichomitus squalens]|uniref:Uncharacterized protein n=1 Tax=Dichomitus squalens TaxID=114155 RepID=A0A4Q9PNB3_9APHY|nr:hypothetical protein BD310DRAFT_669368 [Dichomitus squalens]